MDKAPDLVLGEIAVQKGLISREELAACVEAQRLMSVPKPLGEIMVQMQLVTLPQLDQLLKEQHTKIHEAQEPPRVLVEMFGRIAVEKGYVTVEQVDECLAEQKANPGMRLGQIMMRKGFMTTDRFLEVLKLQEKRVRRCNSCNEETLFSDDQIRAGELKCPKCNSTIESGRATSRRTKPATAAEAAPAALGVAETVATETPPDGALPSPSAPTIRLSSPTRFGSSTSVGTAALEGRQIGRYKLIETLGRGGMGVVYKALDVPLNRTVALKMLRVADAPDQNTILRFLREAKTAASLNHPGIVTVFEVGSLEDAHYFTMEFIEGCGLDKALETGKVTREQASEILEKVARAIDYAHSCGVVHRDLKPANVMVDGLGQPHITDFGLAKELSPATMVTQEGTAVGTPFYMAPEQARGDLASIDARSDVYALGVMLYEVLTGGVPHNGDTAMEIYQKILHEDPIRPSARRPEVPVALERICMKAMEKDKAARYGSAGEFADDLRRYLNGEPVNARPVTLVQAVARKMRRNKVLASVAMLLVVALAGGGYFLNRYLEEKKAADAQKARDERRAKAKVHFDRGIETIDAAEKAQYKKDAKAADLVAKVRTGIAALTTAVETDGTYAEAFHRRGRAKIVLGEWDAAEKDLLEALKQDAGRVGARFDLARLHLRQYELLRGRPIALVGAVGETLALPETETPLAAKAREKMTAEFRDIAERVQAAEEIALSRAVVAWSEGRWEDALNRSMEYQRQATMPESALHLRAMVYGSSKRPREATREFDLAMQNKSALAEPASVLGITPYTRAELDWTAAAYSAAIEQGATPEMLVARGVFRHVLKDFAKAREDYDRALRDKPGYAEALYRRGLLALAEGKVDAAMADGKQLVTSAPEDARGRLLRAITRIEKNEELDGALADAGEASRKMPDDPLALTTHARAQVMSDPDGAYRNASQAIGLVKSVYAAYEVRALARFLTRDYLGAGEDVKKCLELKPDYWRAYATSALVKAAKQDLDGAIADVTQALERKKDDVNLLLRRAEYRRIRGAFEDAIPDYDRVLTLAPGVGEAYGGKALCLVGSGKTEEGFQLIAWLVEQSRGYGLWIRGQARHMMGQFAAAVKDYEAAIQAEPGLRGRIAPALQEARRRADAQAKDPDDWRGFLRRANQAIGQNTAAAYAEAQKDFEKGFMLIPPGSQFSDEERRTLSVSAYNAACTYGVLQAKSKDEETKKHGFERCFHWLQKSVEWGFMTGDASSCPANPKAHTGLEHTNHDPDFDAVRADPRFKKILEAKEEH